MKEWETLVHSNCESSSRLEAEDFQSGERWEEGSYGPLHQQMPEKGSTSLVRKEEWVTEGGARLRYEREEGWE